jgi:hypothetical protein
VVVAGQHALEVRLLAGLGRAPAEQPERVARELGLDDERRDRGGQEHRERRRRERGEQRARLISVMIACWPIEKVLITIDSGRDDASRRARVSMS